MSAPPSIVDEVIRDTVAASRESYASRGIDLVLELGADVRLSTHDAVLREALVTLFQALPERLAPGSVARVRSVARAGGDVELVVEGEWLPRAARPHADLVDLALAGLEQICRARYGRMEITEASGNAGNRRLLLLIPSLKRDGHWRPTG